MNYKKYLAIFCTAIACYLLTLEGSFVFDDTEAIVKNKDVMLSTPLYTVFVNDFWGTDISLNSSHKSYRPLTILSYRLNVAFSGSKLNSFQFHLVNIVLYAILCVLVTSCFELLMTDSKEEDFFLQSSFLAGLLYAVHPVHTESVAALVGRADILSSILFVLSFLLYPSVIKEKSIFKFCTIGVLIFAAVLCKETAITTIGFCIVYDVMYTRRVNKKQFFHPSALCRTLVLILEGLLMLFFRLWVMNFDGPVFTKIDNPAAFADRFVTRVLTHSYIYFLNLLLLLWPQWLCFDWSMGCIPLITNICDIRVIFVLIFWTIFIYTAYKLLKAFFHTTTLDPQIMGIALIVLPFIPASNVFIKVGFVIAERTLLLPSAGFCMLVVIGFKKLLNKFKLNKSVFYVWFFFVIAVFVVRTTQRNINWLNEERLFKSALDVCPLNAKVHYNVAKVAADKGNRMLALEKYRKAMELNPDYEQAMNNLANLLREDGKFREAEVLLRKALKVRPNFAAAWMNLGIVLTNLNQSKEAEYCYLQAISYRSRYPDCYYNLGNLYLDQKRNKEALHAWEMAILHRPTHTAAWSNTLVLLDSMREYTRVLKLAEVALKHNPRSPALHFSVANTLGKLHQFEKAEKHFLEALNFSPQNAMYISNLGVLYHRWGKKDKARAMYMKALQINPNMTTTISNLKKLSNAP